VPTQLVRAIVVDCHIDDVFAHVANLTWLAETRTGVSAQPPGRVVWREGGVEVTCELEEVWTSTRATHREEAARGALRRRARARELARRLRTLKRELERR
jgi:hypothetical protein